MAQPDDAQDPSPSTVAQMEALSEALAKSLARYNQILIAQLDGVVQIALTLAFAAHRISRGDSHAASEKGGPTFAELGAVVTKKVQEIGTKLGETLAGVKASPAPAEVAPPSADQPAGQAPDLALLYQATAQALALAAHNATAAQQGVNTILQGVTTQGVAMLFSVDTAAPN